MSRPDTAITRPGTGRDPSSFCRVTVLSPRSRMDLALPVDLTVAELVPMLTDLAGERGADRTATPGSWCLAAVAGAELPPAATLAGLGVLDGDLLRLRRRADSPPPPVFDDPVDAVAESVHAPDGGAGARPGRGGPEQAGEPFVVRPWDERCRRPTGLVIGALCTVLAASVLAVARGGGEHPVPAASVIAALAAALAVAGAPRLGRVDSTAAVLLATAAVPLAASAGFAGLPGLPGAGHVLLSAALAAAAASVGMALLGAVAPVLVAVVFGSVLTALAGLLATFGIGTAGGLAATVAAVGVGLLPALPRASVRLAGLPPPVIPTSTDEMLAADTRWELASPRELLSRSRSAHGYLAGLVLGASVVAAAGATVAAGAGGWAGPTFSCVVVAVLLLRSRGYVTAAASGAPLLAGLVSGTAVLARLAGSGPAGSGVAAGLSAAGLLVAGAVAVSLVRFGPRRESAPSVRRAVDIVEAVLVVAVFPLALAVLDLYRTLGNL